MEGLGSWEPKVGFSEGSKGEITAGRTGACSLGFRVCKQASNGQRHVK